MGPKSNYILTVDDDKEFNDALKVLLKKLKLNSIHLTTVEQFLDQFALLTPGICLIDINIGDTLGAGLDLIKLLRTNEYPQIPILAVSKVNDKEFMNSVLNLGANDYILKPIDLNIMAQKLKHFVAIDDSLYNPFRLIPLAGSLSPCNLNFGPYCRSITEEGIWIDIPYFLATRIIVKVDHPLLHTITGMKEPLTCTVNSIEHRENGGYRAFLRFDPTNLNLSRKVRHWIYNQRVH